MVDPWFMETNFVVTMEMMTLGSLNSYDRLTELEIQRRFFFLDFFFHSPLNHQLELKDKESVHLSTQWIKPFLCYLLYDADISSAVLTRTVTESSYSLRYHGNREGAVVSPLSEPNNISAVNSISYHPIFMSVTARKYFSK